MNAKKTDLKELEGWYAKSGKSIFIIGADSFPHRNRCRKWEKKFKMLFR